MIPSRITFLPLLLLIAAVNISEADPDSAISHIRDLYKKSVEMEKNPEQSHEVIFNTVLPAIGLQTTRVRFIYASRQADPRRDPYLLEYRLLKVTVKYNIAASINYTIEYLYDAKERPVFFFHQENSAMPMPDEKRFYFRDGKLIMSKKKGRNGDGKDISYSRSRRFSIAEKKEGDAVLRKAREYHQHFKKLIQLENLK